RPAGRGAPAFAAPPRDRAATLPRDAEPAPPQALALARGGGARGARLPREPVDPHRARRSAPARRRGRDREATRAPGREPALPPDRHAAPGSVGPLRLRPPDEPCPRRARLHRGALRAAPRPVFLDEVFDGLALDVALPPAQRRDALRPGDSRRGDAPGRSA